MTPLHIVIFFILHSQNIYALNYYVSINGNDIEGNGTEEKPWRTIGYALTKVQPNKGHTINISQGTFFERSAISVPLRTNIQGAGVERTTIKATRAFFYNPPNPGFEPAQFLMRLDGPLHSNGDQTLQGFTIDGSGKQLHGGIYISGRNNVKIEDVRVKYTNFCGIWILKTKNSTLRKVSLLDCAWGSNEWCSGALQFAYVDHVEFDQINIDEGKGYGIKSLGHDKDHILRHFKLHDSHISVTPKGLWQKGKAPNIAVEIWANAFPESEIYNCYVDNHISIVNNDHNVPPTGQNFRIHHNIIDIKTRAKGEGYGIELTIHDAEIDHNIFKGGYSGITNWSHPKRNWSIHHNIFYGIESVNPTAIINAYKGNLMNVSIYNNTVELNGEATVNFLQCNNGGVSEAVKIQNNLIINSNSHYPSRFINLEKGATIKNLLVENNLLYNLPLGKTKGMVRNNISIDPKIVRSGTRPFPYYLPAAQSPLIDAGIPLKTSYKGDAPDIGAYETR